MNAHCERVIGSIRHEALDYVLIMNEAHARQVLAAYERRRPAAPSAPDAHARALRPRPARAWDEGFYDDLVIRADRETGRSQALFPAGRDDHRWQFLAAERRAPAAFLNRW